MNEAHPARFWRAKAADDNLNEAHAARFWRANAAVILTPNNAFRGLFFGYFILLFDC